MLNPILRFLRPPVFPADEDKTRKAKYANAIALAFLAAAIAFESILRLVISYTDFTIMDSLVVGLGVICGLSLVLLRNGYVRFTSVLLVSMTWIVSNSVAATGFGLRDSSFTVNFAVILMAGLLLGWQASLVTTLISILAGFALAYAETNGLIHVRAYSVRSFAQDMAFIFGLNAVLIYLLINGLENALKRSRLNLEELETANINLNQTQTELRGRSADLITANSQLENRAKKLQAVAEVTRTAASLRDFNQLLASITAIIGHQLEYSHVAIFLLDEQRQYAILRSASTESGLKRLSQGYRVAVGQLGVVSTVAQTGQARLASKIGADKSFLEAIQSQLALPLKWGDSIIGVLDIQSLHADEFTEDDIATLSILADQVGIALQNARLFEESQRALREANLESLEASRRAWRGVAETSQTKGYRYDGIKSEPLKENRQLDKDDENLLIPVQLRGQTIGRMRLRASDRSHAWTEDELVMVKATAERVALALESARLLDEAQKRATREAFLSEVASKLSTSFQVDSILRDTVQELGQTLRNSTVTFQLVNPATSHRASDSRKSDEAASE